jgi:hypothetical protein
MKERKPAPYCVSCCGTIEAVGGRRISSTHNLCAYLDKEKSFKGGTEVRLYKPVMNNKELRVVLGGPLTFWTVEKIERAIELFSSGYDVWFCQKCTGHICRECGEPRNYPHGADILYGGHCAIFPIDCGCTNKKCRKYGEFDYHKKPQKVEIKLNNLK